MKFLPLTLVIAALLALAAAALTAFGSEPRPAPNFALDGGKSLASLRGQPVVLIVAPSPRSKLFRKEIAEMEAGYEDLAARNTVFVAAFTGAEDREARIRSNIPFAVVRNGAGVQQQVGLSGRFGVVVIGKDGNMDLLTSKFAPAYRVRDAIINNFQQQLSERTTF